jgi:hypothetical protein
MTYKQIIKFFSIISYFLLGLAILDWILFEEGNVPIYILFSAIIEVRIHLFKIQREINEEKNKGKTLKT